MMKIPKLSKFDLIATLEIRIDIVVVHSRFFLIVRLFYRFPTRVKWYQNYNRDKIAAFRRQR